jgi:hypothetical protein
MHNLREDHGRQRRLLRRFQHACAARKQGGEDLQSNLIHSLNGDYSALGIRQLQMMRLCAAKNNPKPRIKTQPDSWANSKA